MTRVKIVFLGSGSSVPTVKRNHPAIFLDYGGDKFLWDCGEGTQRQMMFAGLKFMKMSKIFITHWHADHFAGLIGLIETFNLNGRKKPLYIYGPDASRFIDAFSELSYWDFGFTLKTFDVNYEENKITKIFNGKDYEILSIPVEHSVPAVAYCFKEKDRWNIDINRAKKLGLKEGPMLDKLKKNGKISLGRNIITLKEVSKKTKGKKIVYSGDTAPCENILKISKDSDLLIHDSTFIEGPDDKKYLSRNHTNVKRAAEIAKKAGVKKLILTHFSRRYKNLDGILKKAKKTFPNTELSRDFKEIVVD
ncbi:MAG: ribonuclease Z [Candidatus Aenigmarchaeota archaeon]|nr:ribonuclease Z [Candidatus Aenigmarchaeota archaeon]